MTVDVRTGVHAPVMEVFASIQGEGAYVGEPQVFLRLRGCPVRCRYCDTPGSWTLGHKYARMGLGRTTRRVPGDATPLDAACWIQAADPDGARSVSITGGEPLLWPEFVLGLRAVVPSRRLHLETSGAHPRALESVLDAVDHVSLDLKAPSDLDAPIEVDAQPVERAPRDAEEWLLARGRCLALVRGRDACAKLIVTARSDPGELEELLLDVARLARDLRVVLQPATPMNGVGAPAPERLDELCTFALELGLSVRVLPQVHRLLGLP